MIVKGHALHSISPTSGGEKNNEKSEVPTIRPAKLNKILKTESLYLVGGLEEDTFLSPDKLADIVSVTRSPGKSLVNKKKK